MPRKKYLRWNVPIPKPLDEAVEKALEMDAHVSKADFIRDAVRRMLEQLGLYPLPQGEKEETVQTQK